MHFHLEFSGVREDGSSLGVASVVDKHKRADEDYEFKLLNISRSGILRDFPKTATKLLNNELIKNGKEPIKQNEDSFYEKDLSEFEPKKQDESFKYRTQYEIWAKKSGFENLPLKMQSSLATMRNKVGLKADLKVEPIKSNKKWNKSRVKEIVNEKIKEFNDFLNEKGFDDMNLRKPFFENLAEFNRKEVRIKYDGGSEGDRTPVQK